MANVDDQEWQIKLVGSGQVNPKTLIANENNQRTHPPEQLDLIKAMIGQVGWVAPILVNRTTGRIIDGHARVEVAIAEWQERVPVSYCELSPEKELQILALLDYSSSLATVDKERLVENIRSIGDPGDKRLATALADLATLHIGPLGSKIHDGPGDDFAPEEENVPPRSQVGDVFALGWVAECPHCNALNDVEAPEWTLP